MHTDRDSASRLMKFIKLSTVCNVYAGTRNLRAFTPKNLDFHSVMQRAKRKKRTDGQCSTSKASLKGEEGSALGVVSRALAPSVLPFSSLSARAASNGHRTCTRHHHDTRSCELPLPRRDRCSQQSSRACVSLLLYQRALWDNMRDLS